MGRNLPGLSSTGGPDALRRARVERVIVPFRHLFLPVLVACMHPNVLRLQGVRTAWNRARDAWRVSNPIDLLRGPVPMTKATRARAPGVLLDKRGSTDRRSSARKTAEGGGRGRRAIDAAEAQLAPARGEDMIQPRKRRATRDGREPLVVYLRPEAIKALKMAALGDDTTASAIVAEAVQTWLRDRGKGRR